ncbi:MAG: hypothetical protein ABI548_05485 [Polyangiaceae bacterium]
MPDAPYLGDLNKTNILFGLIRVSPAERNDAWRSQFLEALPQASFRCGTPQVVRGPDGFPYFQLLLPEPGMEFQCFVIEQMKADFLLQNGFGIVINARESGPDWVLSHGDIVNLHVNREFYTEHSAFSTAQADEVTAEDEQVLVGQPSEAILPAPTRKLLAQLLQAHGIATPKAALIIRQSPSGARQSLVFNFTPETFPSPDLYHSVMRALPWYLPRHYALVGMAESALGDGFAPL